MKVKQGLGECLRYESVYDPRRKLLCSGRSVQLAEEAWNAAVGRDGDEAVALLMRRVFSQQGVCLLGNSVCAEN